jgi:nicotinate-nucleotide pyrophosphorylase (carboxylating)
MNALIHSWKKWINLGLEEDGFNFDWTARATARARGKTAETHTTAKLIAKANGIWAGEKGLKAVELLSREFGTPIQIQSLIQDGERLTPKQVICEWTGTAEAIVTFERTLINLASYTSGIATATAAYVDQISKKGMQNPPRITATRKTLPGYRDLAIEATLVGGAHPNRFNLSGGLRLKDTHIAASGSI